MKTYCLVVHNSDEVKAVFVSESTKLIVKTLMDSQYSGNIERRLLELYNEDKEYEATLKDEGYIPVTEIPDEDITIDMITSLFHDGDSEDGYTLFDTDFKGMIQYFRHN